MLKQFECNFYDEYFEKINRIYHTTDHALYHKTKTLNWNVCRVRKKIERKLNHCIVENLQRKRMKKGIKKMNWSRMTHPKDT